MSFNGKGTNNRTESSNGVAEKLADQQSQFPLHNADEFPLQVFPDTLQTLVKSLNEKKSFPIDFTACSILFAASVASGNGYYLNKPFTQTPLLYMALVAEAGALKSHPLNFALEPLHKWDEEARKEYEEEKKKAEQEERQKPEFQQNLLSDTTPEALIAAHKSNPKGLGIKHDELSAWFETFDRYHNNAEAQFYNSNWSLQPVTINRKNAEPLYLPNPFISVCGTMHRHLLHKLAGHDRSENGFLDRILFAFPEEVEPAYWSANPDATKEEREWYTTLEQIATASSQRFANERGHVPFRDDAFSAILEWQHTNAGKIKEANAAGNGSKAQLLAKLETYALRLSLLLAIFDKPEAPGISRQNIEGAICLVSYFEACGLKVRETTASAGIPDKKGVAMYLSSLGYSQTQIANTMKESQPNISKLLKKQ